MTAFCKFTVSVNETTCCSAAGLAFQDAVRILMKLVDRTNRIDSIVVVVKCRQVM